jgi:hypothetical protein
VTKLEIVPTTHIAPYGYGKTHGYTRLIRIVPQPLLVGTTDTLIAAIKEVDDNEAKHVTLDDIKASLRQQIRYHCRLNHISAHTALWTLGKAEWICCYVMFGNSFVIHFFFFLLRRSGGGG